MPKLKTRKSAAKRYKLTGSGKLMRRKGGIKHLNEKKTANSKARREGMFEVAKTDSYKLKHMLPIARDIGLSRKKGEICA
jgi:large subunit ribosomal protein L35